VIPPEPDLLQRILYCRRLQSQSVASAVCWLARQIVYCIKLAVQAVLRALKSISRWYRRNEALAELREIEPRILRDTGLNGADLWRIADAYARGVPYVPGKPPYDKDSDVIDTIV
jgi:uncharacterized protein YjiS (DUF1127 family)